MAISKPLVLSDPNLLAEFVRESELRNFFEQRFAAPPDLGALLFRNGELIDAFKGAHFSTGGLATALKSVVGGKTHIALMLADLKPFQVQMPVRGLSRDAIEIAGLATLELQINPDKPANILGMMGGVSRNEGDGPKRAGRTALSRNDVLERIAPHFEDRVIEAVLGRMDAGDIRGNAGLQDKIQADMAKETERICGDLGLMVRSVSISWAINDAEREAFERAQINRQQDALDYQLDMLKRDVARQAEAVEFELTSQVDLTKIQAASEDELAHMILQNEVAFIDAREEVTRRHEMEALAHEIEILRTERAARMEGDLSEASQLMNLTGEAAKLRKTEREIERLDAEHMSQMKKIGAFTDQDISDRAERMALDLANVASEQSGRNLRTLMEIDQDEEDRKHKRVIEGKNADTSNQVELAKAESAARQAALAAGAKMTPEQIMAINAGLSPHVAEVLVEQARLKAAAGGDSMEAMRELIKGAADERQAAVDERADMRTHTLDVLKAGMTGASGVANGASAKGHVPNSDASDSTSSQTECPKCSRVLSAKANFCTGCGHQLRT